MTDAVPAPDTRAIVQRRLVGLVVLLLAAFLLSLLLRTQPDAENALPAVVIPLNSNVSMADSAVTDGAPTLGAAASESSSEEAAPTLDMPVTSGAVPRTPVIPKPDSRASEKSAISKPASTPAEKAPAKPTEKPVVKPAEKPASKPTVAETPKPATAKLPGAVAKPEAAAIRWFVAVGAYKDVMTAEALVSRIKLAGLGAGSVAITSNGDRLHRVRAGPFANQSAAEAARATLIVEGMTKATVVSEK